MTKRSPWVSTAVAARELGVSKCFLYANRELAFKRGKHWRCINPSAYRPTYQWHLKNIEKYFAAEE